MRGTLPRLSHTYHARLAARLSGYRVDIQSDNPQPAEEIVTDAADTAADVPSDDSIVVADGNEEE